MRRTLPTIAALVFCFAPFVTAQQTVNYATVGGSVTDPSGGLVEGADVSVRQVDTNIVSTQKTDRNGRFLFPYLKVGAL